MSNVGNAEFWHWIEAWLLAEARIESAVLFGSSAVPTPHEAPTSVMSDFDLHIISRRPAELESVDWRGISGQAGFVFQTTRPATGGVRKVTAIFEPGQIDLVIVPRHMMRIVCWAIRCRWHLRSTKVAMALNEMATCLHSGYRFVKGEHLWGTWYARVANEMPGVRMTSAEVFRLADNALADGLWILQKLENGELIAAQHLLHRSLVEINLRLIRETRLRQGVKLRSFGLGRRIETWAAPDELQGVGVSAGRKREDLAVATREAIAGTRRLMMQLEPSWRIPPGMSALLRLGAE